MTGQVGTRPVAATVRQVLER